MYYLCPVTRNITENPWEKNFKIFCQFQRHLDFHLYSSTVNENVSQKTYFQENESIISLENKGILHLSLCIALSSRTSVAFALEKENTVHKSLPGLKA